MRSKLILAAAACGLVFAGTAGAQSGDDLLKSKGCMNCHEVDKKKVGPSFKDTAAKYKDNKDAEATIIAKLKEGDPVTGTVERKIKGGLLVDIGGVKVFLPASQVDIRRPSDIGDYIGRVVQCEVLKIDEARRNIVVSRRSLIERQREEDREALLKELEVKQVRKGVVKNIADFGAFVDLGGIDGLLHITDMSWERIGHPSEMVAIDQEIEVHVDDLLRVARVEAAIEGDRHVGIERGQGILCPIEGHDQLAAVQLALEGPQDLEFFGHVLDLLAVQGQRREAADQGLISQRAEANRTRAGGPATWMRASWQVSLLA